MRGSVESCHWTTDSAGDLRCRQPNSRRSGWLHSFRVTRYPGLVSGSPCETATILAKTIHRNEYRQLVDVLRKRRESKGLSQGELARELGWTQQKVSYVETGARRMDVLEFVWMAKALGITPVGAFRQAEKLALAMARK